MKFHHATLNLLDKKSEKEDMVVLSVFTDGKRVNKKLKKTN
jgi:hypothetical protein